MTFNGFPSGKTYLTPIPGPFFSELLPQIDHLGELKLTLYMIWRMERSEAVVRYMRRSDFVLDELFMQGMSAAGQPGEAALDDALQRCVRRGTLLHARLHEGEKEDSLYFINSPRGRAALRSIESGEWRPPAEEEPPILLANEPPNIFRLYEENIGPLTPMLAEALGEAQDTYPASWIREAFQIAVERNTRNWRYISAILQRWQKEGRNDQKDRRDTEEARRRYRDWESSAG
jgi:DnaD/phage-associated family protein